MPVVTKWQNSLCDQMAQFSFDFDPTTTIKVDIQIDFSIGKQKNQLSGSLWRIAWDDSIPQRGGGVHVIRVPTGEDGGERRENVEDDDE